MARRTTEAASADDLASNSAIEDQEFLKTIAAFSRNLEAATMSPDLTVNQLHFD